MYEQYSSIQVLLKLIVICGLISACTDDRYINASKDKGNNLHCESLADIRFDAAVISDAEFIEAGEYIAADGVQYTVPDICKVKLVAVPSNDSRIKIEVWMPAKDWNGRYYQLGTGGFSGDIDGYIAQLISFVREGRAVAVSDTGHTQIGTEASWAINSPEKIIDFGHRSIKQTAIHSKEIISTYYNNPVSYSYFSGCSNGGRQAMMAAHRYPEEWDGVLIGAPANDYVRSLTMHAFTLKTLFTQEMSLIPYSKLDAIQKAALASCTKDAHLVAGVAGDPRFCRFDPSDAVCMAEDKVDCLTVAQAKALGDLYYGPLSDRTGKRLAHGPEPTFENENKWQRIVSNKLDLKSGYASEFFRHMAFNDSKWNIQSMDFDLDIQRARSSLIQDERLDGVVSVITPDFHEMKKKGSKMMVYSGWGDFFQSPREIIKDYELVAEKNDGLSNAQDFYRLFMVPGMLHCSGGPGANAFGQQFSLPLQKNDADHNITKAMEAWVEDGVVPEKIIATKYSENKMEEGVEFTRPLCPYPKVRVYDGEGDIDSASSFICRVNPRPNGQYSFKH